MQQSGVVLQTVNWNFAGTPVGIVAWVELSAALNGHTAWMEIFESSGNAMELGQGPAGSETRITLIPPGGFVVPQALVLPKSMRLSIRALTGTASTGQLLINLKG